MHTYFMFLCPNLIFTSLKITFLCNLIYHVHVTQNDCFLLVCLLNSFHVPMLSLSLYDSFPILPSASHLTESITYCLCYLYLLLCYVWQFLHTCITEPVLVSRLLPSNRQCQLTVMFPSNFLGAHYICAMCIHYMKVRYSTTFSYKQLQQ
jgi:hypothetical protein